MKHKSLFFLIILSISQLLVAETIRNITPYVGSITNELAPPSMDNKVSDTDILKGIFYQQIDPENYQWNMFIFNSDDINKSDLLGIHFISDWYFNVRDSSKIVFGVGIDIIDLSSNSIPVAPSVNIEVSHLIYAPYIRAGYYVYLKSDNGIMFTLMPWAGVEKDKIEGDIDTNITPSFPGQPPVAINTNIDSNYEYGLIGLHCKVDYNHFINCKIKYHRKICFDSEGTDYDNTSLLLNIFFSKNWGVSYRYKYFEENIANISYHIAGISYVF